MYQTHILSNGLRIIHQHVSGKAAYCGVIINVGSRDEEEHEEGIAHFIEHVIFKGTTRRRAYHILNCIESVGGELNAYTTKEDTCIHAAFLPQDYDRVLNLFSDILFNSIFPEKELEKEKEVVLDELNSYRDNPSEQIYDDFEALVYRGDPLGRNILGNEKSVKGLKREDVVAFVQKHYQPHRMVLSSVGDIPFEKLVKLAERYFGALESSGELFDRKEPVIYVPASKEVTLKTYQSHCVIGSTAYDQRSEDRIPLSMLIEIIGGSGMNTRLNMALREKHGLAYNIETGYTPYSNTGLFNIYFGCDEEDLSKCISLTKRELKGMYDKPLTSLQLKKLKRQIVGQITISSENYESAMLANGKSFLVYGKVESLEEIYRRIEAITAEQLQRIAYEVFDVERQSMLLYK
ncbi:MAG: M16 family metallopeptidase [Marinifilaceae bacterium]